MTNTSATGGYLSPQTAPAPLEGDALVNLFQQMVANLSGLAGPFVRPRWQPNPPPLPDNSTDWAAVGIHSVPADVYAVIAHDGTGQGRDILQRHESIHLLTSFYGPGAWSFAARVRDGLSIEQNRQVLMENQINLTECLEPISVPESINTIWYNRVDLTMRFARSVIRSYPVLNLLSAEGDIVNDIGIPPQTFVITN